MANELDGMAAFIAVAETRGFRTAGERLGLSHSAVSQSVRRLEERLGVTLVQRTTRRVRLTDAGERLYAAVRPALDEVRAAVAGVRELADVPRGTLRLHTSSVAQTALVGAMLTDFMKAHPQVRLDVVVSDAPADVVGDGYDAAIQLGEVIDMDMVAVPLTGELRMAVVASPAYLKRRGVPTHPRELAQHDCLNWHPTANSPPYRWEFTEKGRGFTVTVPARVLSTDAALNRRLAIAGLGITMSFESHVREAIERHELVSILETFCAPFPGYYLYYPQRRQASRVLRALIDHMRQTRSRAATGVKSRGREERPRSILRRARRSGRPSGPPE